MQPSRHPAALTPRPVRHQADATAACLAHGRDVLQRLLVRAPPSSPSVVLASACGGCVEAPLTCVLAHPLTRPPPSQHELFALPVSVEQEAALGRVVDLPQPLTRLPREKPLPKPKPPTRWERFAKEKGIQKRQKRSAQMWDEPSQSWKRRHGQDRVAASNEFTAPVVDAKPWEMTGVEDPFSVQRADKKQRVSAQSGRQANNLAAAAKGGACHVPGRATVNLPPLLPGGGPDRNSSLKKAASLARVSTASMGAFPPPTQGCLEEKAPHNNGGCCALCAHSVRTSLTEALGGSTAPVPSEHDSTGNKRRR